MLRKDPQFRPLFHEEPNGLTTTTKKRPNKAQHRNFFVVKMCFFWHNRDRKAEFLELITV